METRTKLLTIDEFFAQYVDRPYELVAGVPVPVYVDAHGKALDVAPTGGKHQIIVSAIAHYLFVYAEETQTGLSLSGEGGVMISRDPDHWRAFDAAYISHERVPPTGIPDGYWEVAPELVVEVVSPGNRADEIRTKASEYLSIGVQLVWVIYPTMRLIDVYRPGQPTLTLQGGDTLTGDAVLPGFSLPLQTLFQALPE